MSLQSDISGLSIKNKMVVNVSLTRKIQKAIFDVKNLNETPQKLLDRLSEYSFTDDDTNEEKNEEEASIEFSVVREVWQVLKKNSLESGSFVHSQ